MRTISFSNEIAERIGLKYESTLSYGECLYDNQEDFTDYIRLITRNGRGEELENYFYEFSREAFSWLVRENIPFSVHSYTRTWNN